jgi:hypothetical protein
MTGTLTGTRPSREARALRGNAREPEKASLQVIDENATGTHGNVPHGNGTQPPLGGVPVPVVRSSLKVLVERLKETQ